MNCRCILILVIEIDELETKKRKLEEEVAFQRFSKEQAESILKKKDELEASYRNIQDQIEQMQKEHGKLEIRQTKIIDIVIYC